MPYIKLAVTFILTCSMIGCGKSQHPPSLDGESSPQTKSKGADAPKVFRGPPMSIALEGIDNISEKVCAGPFTVTLMAGDGKAIESTSYKTFWLELEGATPAWTKFYKSAECKKSIQWYTDNNGDGRSKARLDFEKGVSTMTFYIKSKEITSNQPVVRVWDIHSKPKEGPWAKTIQLNKIESAANKRQVTPSVAQNSLARAAVVAPALSFNEWQSSEPLLERFDITEGHLWRDELIVHSEPFGTPGDSCQGLSARACRAGSSYLSAINVSTGDTRHLQDWSDNESYFASKKNG